MLSLNAPGSLTAPVSLDVRAASVQTPVYLVDKPSPVAPHFHRGNELFWLESVEDIVRVRRLAHVAKLHKSLALPLVAVSLNDRAGKLLF
mgnify:CR=1 FL=1